MAAIGINWGEVWKPVWKAVWTDTYVAPPTPVTALPSWYYTPGPIPMDAPPWMLRELQAVSQSTYGAAPYVQMQVQYREPTKLREGMLIVADGTLWDPGSGAGAYLRIGAAWVKL